MADDGADTYPNAPITEAVCDIRVTARDDLQLAELNQVADTLRADYPTTETQFELQVQVEGGGADEASHTSSTHRAVGLIGRAEAGNRTYQAQLGGVSISQLRPYDRWATLRTEARRIWGIYRGVTKPVRVDRLALRYINRIDIPGPFPLRLETYLKTYIELSQDIKTNVSNFFYQIHLPQNDMGGMCVINSGALPPASPGTASILLDIDLFRFGDVPQDDEQIWAFFEDLRQRKNQIFEACITDETRELFR